MPDDVKWFPAKTAPDLVCVITKIDDADGVRNEQLLVRDGRLWWAPKHEMYVYYTPTHWRPADDR